MWVRPQLALLVKEAPDGPQWLHEIKYDGYRMHAGIEGSDVRLLTTERTRLDAQVPRDRQSPFRAERENGLHRRRAVRAAL
jgi:ATP-dependent DNA ligase